jgi:hypothetical protein
MGIETYYNPKKNQKKKEESHLTASVQLEIDMIPWHGPYID